MTATLPQLYRNFTATDRNPVVVPVAVGCGRLWPVAVNATGHNIDNQLVIAPVAVVAVVAVKNATTQIFLHFFFKI